MYKITNRTIAAIFDEIADLLEIDGANPFRIRAYRRASQSILALSKPLAQLVAEGADLKELPGIGEALAQKITEIVTTGNLHYLDELKKHIPPDLERLLKISGLGPKRVHQLYDALHIRSLSDLQKALEEGKVEALDGFGPKLVQAIADGLKQQSRPLRHRLFEADPVARALVETLRRCHGVRQIEIAGSIRRRKETVKDIDIVASTSMDTDIMETFLSLPDVKRIVMQGPTRSSVELYSGIHVDLRAVHEEAFGSALHHFTGARAHNIALRTMASEQGLKINEYGIYKGVRRIGGGEEKDVYDRLGMEYIQPEMRENRGEIERALQHTLPKLIERKAIRGDLHIHTDRSDGSASLKAMARAAQEMGYEYMAVTDHTKHLTVAHGQDERHLLEALDEIDTLNDKLDGFTILKSTEVDILEDGSLDLSDEMLKRLDLVVGAVHFKFNLSKKVQTRRIITAMQHPSLSILAHPTGRLINLRDPYELDMNAVIAAAKDLGVILELNAQPSRLDLNDLHCKMAKEAGVKIAISTDAHSTSDLQLMAYGIGQARRGWLEPEDVVNTLPLKELIALLRR